MTKSVYGWIFRLGSAGILAPSILPATLHASLPLAATPPGLTFPTAATPTVAPPWGTRNSAAPNEQLLFEWRGRVDKEIRVYMRGSHASVDLVGNHEIGDGRLRVGSALPRTDLDLRVEMLEGRGRVDVVQQPRRENGYTAVVRIRDPRSGAGTYRIRAYALVPNDWRGNGGWNNRGNGGWDDRNGANGDQDDQRRSGWYRHRDNDRDD